MKLRFTLAALAALTLAPAADAGPIRRALARTHHVAANVVAVARHAVHSVAPRAAVAAPAVAPAACTGPNCPAPQFLPVPGTAPMPMAGPGNTAKVVGATLAPPTVTGSAMASHPLYHAWTELLLHREARKGNAGAAKILANPEMLEFFRAGLPGAVDPTPVPPTPPAPSNHPILDQIVALIQKVIANPQGLIQFIELILSLFPK